jgi:poly(A) polymerase
MTKTNITDNSWIHPHALSIVQRLHSRGHLTYLVGGCVRDFLLGKKPKDFDIATLARPNEVKKIVPFAYVIGRRFRLVLVKRDNLQFEVATFRQEPKDAPVTELVEPIDESDPETDDDSDLDEDANDDAEDSAPDDDVAILSDDNLFGTPEQDAYRRDFTINALFYDPASMSLIDHADGLKDLKAGLVKMIGDPMVRLTEDPIRILRGIRLAHMVKFATDSDLKKAMEKKGDLLSETPLPRRREEYLKFLRLEDPSLAFIDCFDLGFAGKIFPHLLRILNTESKLNGWLQGLRNFHNNVEWGTPAELFAAFVWQTVLAAHEGEIPTPEAAEDFLTGQLMQDLMRFDLGVFKLESETIIRSIMMVCRLNQSPNLEQISQGQRHNIMRSEASQIGLLMAFQALILSPERFQTLMTEAQGAYVQYQSARRQRRRPNNRRRFRPPRRR